MHYPPAPPGNQPGRPNSDDVVLRTLNRSPDPGYRTPTEESHPPFTRNEQPTPTYTSPSPRPGPTAKRPPLMQLPSYYLRRREEGGRHHVAPSLDDMLHRGVRKPKGGYVGFRERVACYQWTFFTMTMATGGIASVLYAIPYRARWLEGVGVAFALLNIALFIMNCIFITMRFRMRPGSFVGSFTDQVESLFINAFVVSIGMISTNICQYGIPHTGPWLVRVMEVIFWIYLAVSVIASSGMYLIMWSTLVFPIHMMTPTWVFPAYPLLLTAPFAAALISAADSSATSLRDGATGAALAAITTQGTGFLIAFLISAAFIYRLMTQKLPRDFQRPGIFISIGPYAFTVAGMLQLSKLADVIPFPAPLASETLIPTVRLLALLPSLWLYGLTLWFFIVSVGSLFKYTRRDRSGIPFRMTWWSFVFPNTALVTATLAMGNALESEGVRIFGCVMAALLILVWGWVFFVMVRCYRKRELLWPKDDF